MNLLRGHLDYNQHSIISTLYSPKTLAANRDIMRQEWTNAKRIVVKIGSSLLVDEQQEQLRTEWLLSLTDDIARFKQIGKDVIIVASGAKALGRQELNLGARPLTLDEAQAAAAIGQISLSASFKSFLKSHELISAQILLTLEDTEDRRRYLNARDTLNTLIQFGAVPVVNENDTVATNELRYGDNDRLAARVASMVEADVLIILSDIDGLYTAPPNEDNTAKHIEVVEELTPEIEAMAGGTGSELSSGGMVTKLVAAKIANATGCHMVITSGERLNPLNAFLNGAKATWFLSNADSLQARKSWIAGALDVKGTMIIDRGAEKALYAGNSLLPAGVTQITGSFKRGDFVSIANHHKEEIGHGISSYNSDDAGQIIGMQSAEIEAILGFSGRTELIHRDNMAFTKGKTE